MLCLWFCSCHRYTLYWKTGKSKKGVKSFPSHKAHGTPLISVSSDLGQTPALHYKTTHMELVYRMMCPFHLQLSLVLIAPTHRDGQAELTWVAGYILGWFTYLQTVTHPSTNWDRRRVTLLIEINSLSLSQTAVYLKSGALLHFQITLNKFGPVPVLFFVIMTAV